MTVSTAPVRTDSSSDEDEESSNACLLSRCWRRTCWKPRIVPATQVTSAESKEKLFLDQPTSVTTETTSLKRKSCCWRLAVPFTLESWRWGLQECLSMALVLWIPYVDRVNNGLLRGSGRWCVPAAVAVIEGTAGGSTRRMWDRVIGTALACIYVECAYLIFCGVYGKVRDEPLWRQLLLWFIVCLSGWWWGWFRWRFPTHPLLASTAAFTTPLIYAGGMTGMDPHEAALMRTVCCLIGIFVSAWVVRYFFPRRARIDVLHNLETILEELANTLEPLVELESGLVSSPSFLAHGDEVFAAHRSSLRDLTQRHRVRIGSQAWATFRSSLWSKLEQCGKLTLAQLTLMTAAKGEASLRSRHPWAVKELSRALVSTRTLFYHVSSLFTLIDTQVSATSASFGEAILSEEAKLFGRFGMLSLQGSGIGVPALLSQGDAVSGAAAVSVSEPNPMQDKTVSAPALRALPKSSNAPLRSIPYSVADLGALDMRRWDSRASLHGGDAVSHGDAVSQGDVIFHGPRAPLDPVEEYNADIAPFLRWAEIYGPTVGGMVRHLCKALRAAAACLRDNRQSPDGDAALEEAGKLIALFHRQRAERQQAVAILVEYSVRDADGSNLAHDPKFADRFDRVLGISPQSYRDLSDEGREMFWLNYWILRDRLSTTDTNVVSLLVAVRNVLKSIQAVVAERLKYASKHKVLVSAEEVRLQAEFAVQNAGGAARNIG
eukprot:Gregarina_sp_Pseudo_9__5455@NODE_688_length_2363_cov_10_785714_g651_i0_p1_GENE_NODE_688_length_2363_cov_10_785714_g651_i0NODE_688_length_2363_cov_10_785714_g651_i0_p1_ORF_typecomplete_len718_score236_77ALMT/PF11744_8/3_7e16ALMT/PF11744_8/1e03FUSC/PF04632_12/3_4e13FUSC/PF04632_12/5_9e02FUSC_2/PF13515_6/2_8e10ArAE_1/PF06081_11/0_0013ArAE_2_N/PF10337_9/0_011ArAE_2_N/PF10337_9/3_2e02Polysacc_synt/PF01943_17/0_69DUF3021/PF11457_8/31_NODE_688_length_2363_cov_10_785714_g651_i0622215